MNDMTPNTILLVEDEVLLAMDEQMTLENYGYKVIITGTGEEAVEIVHSNPNIDLILMDINLGSGIEGTEAARQILAKHDLPLIFLSSHTEREIVEKTEGITSYGYIVKNSGETVLIASIKMAFRLFEAKMIEQKKETALRQSEEKYRSFFSQSVTGIYLHDLQGNIIDANQAACRQLGYSKEEILRMSVFDFHPETPETPNMSKKEILREWNQWQTGQRITLEAQHQRKDGKIFPVQITTGIVSQENEKLILAISQDITERKQAENSLKASEELFRKLVMTVPDLVLRTDTNGIITFVNEPAEPFKTFLQENNVLGKNIFTFIAEKDRNLALKNTKLMFEKPLGVKEYRLTMNEDYELTCEVNGDVLWDDNHNPIGMVYVIRDISERKEMENRIRETQKELEGYFSSSLDLLCIANTSGEFIRLNPEWENLLGYSVKELEGKNFLDYVHPDDLESTLAKISDLEKQNDVLNFINRYRSKDGSYRWIEWRSKPQGETIYAVARDITERRKIEEELRNTKNYLENLLNYANAAIIVWDNNFKITRFNKAFERLSGLKESEVLGKKVDLIFPPSTREKSLQYIRQASAGKRWEAVEIEIQNQNGEIYTLLWNSAVIYTPYSKSIIATIAQGQDITERKRAEKNINTLLREKEMLLKETHHRIKNNMAVVKSLLNMQANEQDNPVCRNILQDAASRVQSMVILYNKLYRSETYSELSIKEFLLPLIQEIMDLFRLDSKVQTSINIADFILPAKILSSLAIILNECITNSMKYAFKNVEHPTITVSVTRKGNLNKLIYSDNGCGIPDSAIQEGTNTFGLNLIKMLVEEIKGEVKIENDPGAKYTIEFKVWSR
ncbi:MAG: hypothetical protein APR54_09655 [Candidatus Cloacimonas sp. SDB]|nr:MAG: hypothetical protein APR54_09655 [Candidatus Cloacimonas sp. SDB]